MLKEICITPHVFDNDILDYDAQWKDVKSLIQNIANSGFIIGLHNKDWNRHVLKKIEKLTKRDDFKTLFNILKDRKRIVGHPKGKKEPKCEEDWVEIAKELNDKKSLNLILTSKSMDSNTTSVNSLNEMDIPETFGITGSKHVDNTKEDELRSIYEPLLGYARKLTLIDPYFDVSKPRYKKTLELISECFKNRRGNKEKNGEIKIHCRYNKDKDIDAQRWKEIIEEIYANHDHIVSFNIWEEKGEEKMHDRYVITDQAGVSVGKGLDVDLPDKPVHPTDFALIDYEKIVDIENKFNENKGQFHLKRTIC